MLEGEESREQEPQGTKLGVDASQHSYDGSSSDTVEVATMLTSPQRLSPDRLLAARASAAKFAASAVRVGYVAAALARAGRQGHTPLAPFTEGTNCSSGTLPHYSMATAAVRAAAAHATSGGPEDAMTTPRTPRATGSTQAAARAAAAHPEDGIATPRTPRATGSTQAAGAQAAPDCNEVRPAESCDPIDAEVQSPEGEVASSEEVGASWMTDSEMEFRQDCDANHASSETATAVQPTKGHAIDSVGHTLCSIVVGPARQQEASAEDSSAVWDVVVKKTFISVVPRRQVLPHTASAPGRIGILGEAGRTGSRPRRLRSSRRRSRRRRVGAEPAAASNSVQRP